MELHAVYPWFVIGLFLLVWCPLTLLQMSESFKAVFISSNGWTHDVIIIWLQWVDNAAVNMSVLTVGAWAFSSFGYIPRRKTVGSHGNSMRNVLKACQTTSCSLCIAFHSHQNIHGIQLSTPLHRLCFSFSSSYPLKWNLFKWCELVFAASSLVMLSILSFAQSSFV